MRYRNSGDFLLVSKLADIDQADEKKAILALSIFTAMILAGCISFEDAGKIIDFSV